MKDYSNYSDLELVTLLKEDGRAANDAFNVIYMKYSSQVYGYCLYRSSSSDEAKELMQETWISFFNCVRGGKTIDRILPFVFTIARNQSINRYRQKQSPIRLFSEETIDIEEFADISDFRTDMEKDEVFRMIKIGIHSLKDIYKDTLLLYWFGGFKIHEIASICGENDVTVRKRFSRAMEQLNKILKPYFIDN